MTYSKYKAKKCVIDGYRFDSLMEGDRYQDLRKLEIKGDISDLTVHPAYPIELNGKKICKVVLDFEYMDHVHGQFMVEDVKGHDNPVSRLKRKLVEAAHDIKVIVIKN